MHSQEKKNKEDNKYLINAIKFLLIAFLVIGFYQTSSSVENKISLLAVSEDSRGNIVDGSIIDLKLRVKPGSGQIFVNLDTIGGIDTQISIVNSQKVACQVFELPCDRYDFFYNFEGSTTVLRGPSASSAIAILVAKTLNQKRVNENVVITGSLSSGGVIGNVGGVDEKIRVAKRNGFEKVIVPQFSTFDRNNTPDGIEVVEVIDIIEAYNSFGSDTFKLSDFDMESVDFSSDMERLAEKMCLRAEQLSNQIDYDKLDQRSENYLELAKRSLNFSNSAYEKGSYYSRGSFCYNANINFRTIIEIQENLSMSQILEKEDALKTQVQDKLNEILTPSYRRNNLGSLNDFYIYLILNDRLEESSKILSRMYILSDEDLDTRAEIEHIRRYSNAIERFYTVFLWEEFLDNGKTGFDINNGRINRACLAINRELNLKYQLLDYYNINIFNDLIIEQNRFQNGGNNQYLCIYKGLELNGRINTVLNSAGINNQNSEHFAEVFLNLTQTRLGMNYIEGEFPVIPYIYYEYSRDLLSEGDRSSSILYSNFALSYTDLNLYLEAEEREIPYLKSFISDLMENIVFIAAMLTIIAFLS